MTAHFRGRVAKSRSRFSMTVPGGSRDELGRWLVGDGEVDAWQLERRPTLGFPTFLHIRVVRVVRPPVTGDIRMLVE